jgi:hypothetical protein
MCKKGVTRSDQRVQPLASDVKGEKPKKEIAKKEMNSTGRSVKRKVSLPRTGL